jgi:hypothetical protein
MNTTELIIDIATRLGWSPTPIRVTCQICCVQMGGGPGPEIVWPNDPIKFAAYAKVEMVKRGFYFHYHIDLGDHRVAVCTGHGGRVGANHEYDPTDPVSEAAAVLRCCADAL